MLKELKATCFLVNIIDSIGRHFVSILNKGLGKNRLENTHKILPSCLPIEFSRAIRCMLPS